MAFQRAMASLLLISALAWEVNALQQATVDVEGNIQHLIRHETTDEAMLKARGTIRKTETNVKQRLSVLNGVHYGSNSERNGDYSLGDPNMRGMQARAHHDSMPLVAWRAFEALAESKRELLEKGSVEAAQPQHPEQRGSVFEAVEVSLPLEPPVLKHNRYRGAGGGDKNIVGLNQLTRGGRQCVVYGMGIADDSSFEQQMQQSGCETHAFDCTVSPSSPAVAGKSFHFHNWCIGHQGSVSFADNTYVKGNKDALQFKSLSDTMKELNHTYIDLLKFDIEGFEWQLFQSQILTSDNPPEQLSFELHTQKANPAYVPQGNVHDKGYKEVNELFRSLYDLGYRVTSKELNSGDPACAEFVAVHVDRNDA